MLNVLVAHAGLPLQPHDLWAAWSLEPSVVLGLVALVALYVRGRAGASTSRGRDAAFAGAVAALVVALVSPLDALSGSLASAHMVQHVLLTLVAAPLLALAAPSHALLRGSPRPLVRATARARRRAGLTPPVVRAIQRPEVAWTAFAAGLWVWHASVPYGAALRLGAVHLLEHATFLGAAWLLWSVVVRVRDRRRDHHAAAVLALFTTALHSVLLAALMTFAGTPWYDGYAGTTAAFGLTHLADQQLAGVIMWVPSGLVFATAGVLLVAAWIRDSESEARPLQRA